MHVSMNMFECTKRHANSNSNFESFQISPITLMTTLYPDQSRELQFPLKVIPRSFFNVKISISFVSDRLNCLTNLNTGAEVTKRTKKLKTEEESSKTKVTKQETK